MKRRLLGLPLVNEQLGEQRLSNPVAFGVLAPDCISSSAYGTEEILIELLPYAGLAAFALVLPITGVILGILLLLLFSYRQVLTVYTKAGGSYVVARENFGPRIAQIAAVALLIDYVVTVSVQTAAGSAAVARRCLRRPRSTTRVCWSSRLRLSHCCSTATCADPRGGQVLRLPAVLLHRHGGPGDHRLHRPRSDRHLP